MHVFLPWACLDCLSACRYHASVTRADAIVGALTMIGSLKQLLHCQVCHMAGFSEPMTTITPVPWYQTLNARQPPHQHL